MFNRDGLFMEHCRVDEWNAQYPAGTPVILTKDDGSEIETVTRSEARVLPSGHAVIWVNGITGCYALERVKPGI